MPGFILNDGAVVPPSVYSAMNTVLNKKLGTSQVYPPRDWAAIVKDLVPLPLKSASGSIAHFEDGADTVPLKSLTYRFAPTQSGTGDPSPSNPRTINAVTTANVVHAGANLVDSSKVSITTNRNDLSSDKAVLIKAGITYTASISNVTNASSWRFCFRVYDAAGNLITNAKSNGYISSTALADTYDTNKTLMQGSNSTATNIQFECLKDCYIAAGLSSGDVSASTTANYQLEVGSTPTTYEPFTSTTHPVDFGTVYGGEGNEAGEFTSTYKLETIDGSMVTSVGENGGHKYASVVMSEFSTGRNVDCLCDRYKPQTAAADLVITWVSSTQKVVWIYDDTFTDLATAQASLNNNPVNYCYPLATPATLSVDPVALSSRLGVNNIYLDLAGSEIECEYYADPTLSTL